MAQRGERIRRLLNVLGQTRSAEGRKLLRQRLENDITRPLEKRLQHQLEGRLMGAMLDVSRISNDGSYSGLRTQARANTEPRAAAREDSGAVAAPPGAAESVVDEVTEPAATVEARNEKAG